MKIIVYDLRDDEKPGFERLKDQYNIELVFTKKHLTLDTVEKAAGADGVTVLGHARITGEILAALARTGVSVISTRTIGYNHIDIAAAKKHGIRVCNAIYGPYGVADYTVMLMLMSVRKYKQALFRGNVNDYSLKGLQGREMKDLTIGVIGTGNIGAQVIKNLSGFGCNILAYDTRHNPEVESLSSYVALDDLYKNADLITYHVPLLESTRHMLSSASLARMKPGVILVNCSRGELMDIKDVTEGIEKQQIGALALDVFDGEEGIYHYDRRTDILSNRDMAYLRQFPNVTMTQHMAFYTDTAVNEMVTAGIESIISVCKTGSHARMIQA